MTNIAKLRLGVGVLIIGLISWTIYYAATHGRIVVENVGDKAITITPLENANTTLETTEIGNGSFVRSGSYAVKNNQNGQLRIAQVTVPNWFAVASITFNEIKTAKIDRVAALTYENLFPAENGQLISYTDLQGFMSEYTSHAPTDAFGGKSNDTKLETHLLSPITTSKGDLLGISGNNLLQVSPITSKGTSLISIGESGDLHTPPIIKRSSNVGSDYIAVYKNEKKEMRIIDSTRSSKTYSSISTGQQSTAFDVNDYGWAVAKNTADAPENAATEEEETRLPYEVRIQAHTATKQTILDIGSAMYLSAIALSENGEHMAVSKDGYLWVYETKTGAVVMVNPVTNANQLFWKGTKLYSLSTELGVTVFDTATQQLLPISLNTDETLAFSKAAMVDGKLYVTAYNANFSSDLPDGYVIDLEAQSDGVTEALAKKLPITTDSYEVNYLGSVISVRIRNVTATPTRIEEVKRAAKDRLSSVIPGSILSRCTVVFTD